MSPTVHAIDRLGLHVPPELGVSITAAMTDKRKISG